MPTFAELAARGSGVGVTFRLDVSLDGFATVAYRYGSHAGALNGVNEYDPRLMMTGALSRSFGVDHIAAAGSVDISLENVDGGVDWLVNRATAADVLKARCRLYIGLFDLAAFPSVQSKQLGEFVFVGFPRRDGTKVQATLGDDVLGALEQAISTPTLTEWEHHGLADTETNMPMGYGFQYALADKAQLPLAFGSFVPAATIGRLAVYYSTGADLDFKVPVLVCASLSAPPEFPTFGVLDLFLIDAGGTPHRLPTEYPASDGVTHVLYQPMAFGPISKDGSDWYIHWLAVDLRPLAYWIWRESGLIAQTDELSTDQSRPAWVSFPGATPAPERILSFVHGWRITARPLSGVSDQLAFTPHAIDVLKDLLSLYAQQPVAYDSDRFTDAKSATPAAVVSGVIGRFAPKTIGELDTAHQSLREHVTQLCQSTDLDFYVNWSGQASVYTAALNSETDVDAEFLETDLAGFEDWIPSEGERGAPYNRLFMAGPAWTRPDPEGPFDNPDGIIALGGRILERRLRRDWADRGNDGRSPWDFRRVESLVRPRCRFKTDLRGLLLDLGSLFRLTWTRGHGGPYIGELFVCEGISFSLDDCSVTVEGLWFNDISTAQNSFLLDTEASLIRSAGSGGRTLTVTQSSAVVTFSSGSLITDGVVAGDHLVLLDSGASAAHWWQRHRAIRIASRDSATQLTLTGGDYDFGATTAGITGWQIRKSHLTAATPAYGKVADSVASGLYSDATASHLLRDG